MQIRSAAARWILVILCAGALWASLVAADTAPQTPISANSGKVALAATDVDPQTAEPTFKPRLYTRNVAWWPYTTGPHYGDLDLRGGDLPDDVLLTHVGSFRIGQGLAIPAELTGSLAGLATGKHQYFLIQMRADSINSEWPQTLASMGAVVVGRTPSNGAFVRADRAAFDMLSGSPLIQFIEPYHPAYKIHPTVGRVAQTTPEEAASPIFQLQVTLWPGEPAAATADLLSRLGATVKGVTGLQEYGETIEASAHAALIPEIARLESVVLITESAPLHVFGARGALFMQSEDGGIGDYPYWKAGIDGDGQIVAVLDTRPLRRRRRTTPTRPANSGWSRPRHQRRLRRPCNLRRLQQPQQRIGSDRRKLSSQDRLLPLAGRRHHRRGLLGMRQRHLRPPDSRADRLERGGSVTPPAAASRRRAIRDPPTRSPRTIRTASACAPSGRASTTTWTGTACSARHRTRASTGSPRAPGSCSSMPPPAAPRSSTTASPPGDLVATVGQARTQHGATVFNGSWGSDTPDTNPIYSPSRTQHRLAVNNHPIMLWSPAAGNGAEAGNNGINASGSTLCDHASCKNCLAVGASFGYGGMFSFTSEGPAYLGSPLNRSRVAPTIMAEGIDSACRSEDVNTENQSGAATCLLQQAQGTSFSAPNIAGAAALIREYFDQGFYNNKPTKAISSRLLRALMFAGATPIVSGKTFIPRDRFNNVWGYGQLQLTRVLPLVEFPETVEGLIVHDLPPADINGDGITPDGVSDLSLPGTINGGQTLTSEFSVNGVTDDLAVVLAWDDSLGAAGETGVLNDNLNLVVRYCGANGTCGDGDDQTYKGNAFSEDPERDGTRNANLLVNGSCRRQCGRLVVHDSRQLHHGGRRHPGQWVDLGNNSEAVFVATYQNRPDENLDGTADFAALCNNADPNCTGGTSLTGKWRVEISAAAAVPSGRPFVVAIAGPVTAGSTVRFTNNPIVCNGESRVVVEEKAAAGGDLDPALRRRVQLPVVEPISSRTILEVLDANNVVQDTETGLVFDPPPAGSLRFQTTNPIPVSVDASAAGGNGVLYIQNGWRVRVRYSDNNGSSTVIRESEAAVDCQAGLEVYLLPQVGRDTYFRLDGGCDDDRYLDFGEAFGLTFRFFNQEDRELPDAELELKAVDADTCPANDNDPCRNSCAQASFIRIDNPIQKIGLLPPLALQNSTFSLSVVGTPPARRRVEFVLGIRSEKAGQGEKSCQTFRTSRPSSSWHRPTTRSRYFTTDCQTGCVLNFDRNSDEKLENRIPPNPFDPFDFALRGKDETAIQYLSLTTPTRTASCAHCAQNGAVGGPWDFDSNAEGFRSGVSQTSALAATDTDGCSNWGEDKNWNNMPRRRREPGRRHDRPRPELGDRRRLRLHDRHRSDHRWHLAHRDDRHLQQQRRRRLPPEQQHLRAVRHQQRHPRRGVLGRAAAHAVRPPDQPRSRRRRRLRVEDPGPRLGLEHADQHRHGRLRGLDLELRSRHGQRRADPAGLRVHRLHLGPALRRRHRRPARHPRRRPRLRPHRNPRRQRQRGRRRQRHQGDQPHGSPRLLVQRPQPDRPRRHRPGRSRPPPGARRRTRYRSTTTATTTTARRRRLPRPLRGRRRRQRPDRRHARDLPLLQLHHRQPQRRQALRQQRAVQHGQHDQLRLHLRTNASGVPTPTATTSAATARPTRRSPRRSAPTRRCARTATSTSGVSPAVPGRPATSPTTRWKTSTAPRGHLGGRGRLHRL